jgi:hypothetical protein
MKDDKLQLLRMCQSTPWAFEWKPATFFKVTNYLDQSSSYEANGHSVTEEVLLLCNLKAHTIQHKMLG